MRSNTVAQHNRERENALTDAYLDLVARTILNFPYIESGLRIQYLLDCIEKLEKRGIFAKGKSPFSLNALKDITKQPNMQEAYEKLLAGEGQWYDKIYGFPFSMVGPKRLENVRQLSEEVLRQNIPGDFMETGVWRGGCCIMMKAVLNAYGDTSRKIYACDSFEGLPEPTADADKGLKLHENILLECDQDAVERNFNNLGLLDENVIFVKGYFEDTLPTLETGPIALLRLDGDYYSSTMDTLQNMYDRVSPGGYIIIDDYGCYDACKQAVHDFLKERNLEVDMQEVDWSAVYWRKAVA